MEEKSHYILFIIESDLCLPSVVYNSRMTIRVMAAVSQLHDIRFKTMDRIQFIDEELVCFSNIIRLKIWNR
jgi:hypothetical protein